MKTGVGLILIAETTGRLLILRELKSKPEIEKEAGMISFPLETVKNGEAKETALQRLIFEEIGIDLQINPTFFGGIFSIVQNAQTVAAYAFCEKEFKPHPTDNDIEYFGWLLPQELMHHDVPIRKEVLPIIQHLVSMGFPC